MAESVRDTDEGGGQQARKKKQGSSSSASKKKRKQGTPAPAPETQDTQGSSKSIIKRLNIGKMYAKKKTKKKSEDTEEEDVGSSTPTTGTPEHTPSEETASQQSESVLLDKEVESPPPEKSEEGGGDMAEPEQPKNSEEGAPSGRQEEPKPSQDVSPQPSETPPVRSTIWGTLMAEIPLSPEKMKVGESFENSRYVRATPKDAETPKNTQEAVKRAQDVGTPKTRIVKVPARLEDIELPAERGDVKDAPETSPETSKDLESPQKDVETPESIEPSEGAKDVEESNNTLQVEAPEPSQDVDPPERPQHLEISEVVQEPEVIPEPEDKRPEAVEPPESTREAETPISPLHAEVIKRVRDMEEAKSAQDAETSERPQQPEAAQDSEDRETPDVTEDSKTGSQREAEKVEERKAPPSPPATPVRPMPEPSGYTFQQQGGGGQLKKECLYKVLVIGELGTGKTSIIKRYVHQFFSQHYRATIGVDFALKVINWDQDTIIRLQLWDIAGQERFGNMTRVYYKEAVGAMIVFDVTRVATFDAVLKWKQDLDSKVQLPDGSSIPCILLANKCDQPKEGLVNQPNKMDEFCREHNFTGWFETSAKENINIEKAAQHLVAKILELDTSSENGRSGGNHSGVYLHEANKSNSSSSCSC